MSKENHFRNTIDVVSDQGIEVDAQSLWLKKDNTMILVDDDQYVTLPYSTHFQPE